MNERTRRPLSGGVFLAFLVVVLTMFVQAGFDNVQLRRAKDVLDAQYAQQREAVEQSQTLRAQLEGIAGATAALAEKGNQNAILIRDQLQSQGITIRPRAESP